MAITKVYLDDSSNECCICGAIKYSDGRSAFDPVTNIRKYSNDVFTSSAKEVGNGVAESGIPQGTEGAANPGGA